MSIFEASVELTGPLEPACGDNSNEAKPGRIGLQNLGNTCFMNAGLQCLSHIEPLTAFFLSGQFYNELNPANPLGCGGALASAFAELQKTLWHSGPPSQDPADLRDRLKRLAPYLFEGGQQQDVQELLAFCLDGLHEDMNRVVSCRSGSPGRGKRPQRAEADLIDEERIAAQRGDEFVAALMWIRHLEHNRSFLVDLMQGQLRSTLTCVRCGHQSRSFDPFLYLSVPVARSMTKLTDALHRHLEEEVLKDGEQWYCEKCKKKTDAKKKIDLWKLPPVLIIHLKRFEFDASTLEFKKIDTHLASELSIDLSEFCSSPQRLGALYDVACVANHIGEQYEYGHYTANCRVFEKYSKNSMDDLKPLTSGWQWHCFDDEGVRPIEASSNVIGPEAYVIFLERRNVKVSDEPVSGEGAACPPRRQTVTMPEHWPHQLSANNSIIDDLLPGRVGSSAAVACKNPRSALLPVAVPENLRAGNPRSAMAEGGYNVQPLSSQPFQSGILAYDLDATPKKRQAGPALSLAARLRGGARSWRRATAPPKAVPVTAQTKLTGAAACSSDSASVPLVFNSEALPEPSSNASSNPVSVAGTAIADSGTDEVLV